jgi:hypothetical protein
MKSYRQLLFWVVVLMGTRLWGGSMWPRVSTKIRGIRGGSRRVACYLVVQ